MTKNVKRILYHELYSLSDLYRRIVLSYALLNAINNDTTNVYIYLTSM